MIGIKAIGAYIPEDCINNLEKLDQYQVTEEFITDKIGVRCVPRKKQNMMASDLCLDAFRNLVQEEKEFDVSDVDFICVCTENGDYQIPYTAAVVHGKLGLPSSCASFDVNQGCSGYVYTLTIAKNMMEANGLNKGLVFTADPYSDIIDENDKNTALLFGDAATVTLMTTDPVLEIAAGVFETYGLEYEKLIKRAGQPLHMDGRAIFNMALRNVPSNLEKCLQQNGLSADEVDLWILHQASRYIIENLSKMMKLDPNKVPLRLEECGNTVSSTIPLVLKEYLHDSRVKTLAMSGFGVGLSIASTLAFRSNH